MTARSRSFVAMAGVLPLGLGVAFTLWAEPIGAVRAPEPVVFVCRNGVAMSVWSAAYFNRLAEARNLRQRAIARAAIPSFTDVPLRMEVALALDGFRIDGYRPHVVSSDDLRDAEVIVAIDTDLPPETGASESATEVWSGFPPMRERYFPSRKALRARVEALVERLAMHEHARADRPAGRNDEPASPFTF